MPLKRTLLLHLAPGVAIALFYVLTAPFLVHAGFPRTAALLLGFLLIGMPLQLSILRKQTIRFREPMPAWLFAVLVIALFGIALAIVMFVPMSPISDYLATRVFFWAPSSILPIPDNAEHPARTFLLITLIAQLIIDGIVNPIVEEFYFRGFLLPNLERLGWLAPVVNAALFTLGHLWQPYNYVTIFVTVLPLTCVTWWRRNFYMQMVIHCLANTLGASISLYAFFHP